MIYFVEKYRSYFRLEITLSSFVFASIAAAFTAGSSFKTPSIRSGSRAVITISSPDSCTVTLHGRNNPTSRLAVSAMGQCWVTCAEDQVVVKINDDFYVNLRQHAKGFFLSASIAYP